MSGVDAARPQRTSSEADRWRGSACARSRWATWRVLLIIPVIVIIAKAFEDGAGNVFDTLTTPEAQHAFWLTLVMVAVAIPLNTIFGVACALVLVRHNFRGKGLINALIDLPFAISPVVIGLALVLVYGSLRRLVRQAGCSSKGSG